jgi:hypothetical protein
MGYHNHHAIIVTAWDEKYIKETHEKAIEIFGETCSEVVGSKINGYVSFFIAPDGSKESGEDSNAGNNRRDDFKRWINKHDGCLDAVEIYYGGDEPDINGIEVI